MSAVKPTTVLRWCNKLVSGVLTKNVVVDGTSGQPNVATPSSGTQDNGYPFNQRPSRQNQNWFNELGARWIFWLEYVADLFLTGSPRSYLEGFLTAIENTKTLNIGSNGGIADVHTDAPLAGRAWTRVNKTGPSNLRKILVDTPGTDWEDWAPGDSAGGAGSSGMSAIADKLWTHVFIIYDPVNGILDGGFDTDVDGTNLLADANAHPDTISAGYNYTHIRRVGSVQVIDDGGGGYEIRPYLQRGNEFTFKKPDIQTGNFPDTNYNLFALNSIPKDIGVLARIFFNLINSSGGNEHIIYLSGEFSTPAVGDGRIMLCDDGNTEEMIDEVLSNTDQEIYLKGSSTDVNFDYSIAVYSYTDTRGRESGTGTGQ